MPPGRLAMDCLLLAILVVAAAMDLRTARISNALTYSAALAALALHGLMVPPGLGLGASALGLLAGFLPMLVLYVAGGVGGGDVKLMGAVGAFLGPRPMLFAYLYVFLVGALLAICVVAWHEGFFGLKDRAVAAFRRPREAERAPHLRFPFAVAILGGVAWLLAERHFGASLLPGMVPDGA